MKNMKINRFFSIQFRVKGFGVLLFLSVFFLPVFSAEKYDFKEIDATVLEMRRHKSMEEVIEFIARHSQNDWDRARGAYVWIANNITYDVDSYLSETKKMMDAKEVFAAGKSICQGYATLFSEITRGLGLQTVTIDGYAKAYGFKAGMQFKKTNHTWNAVKIKNKWHFIETTWGAGSFDGKKFIRNYNATWFNTDPRLFVQNHFPKDTSWLLTTPMSLTDYEKMPYIETFYIQDFSDAGFSVDEQLNLLTYLPFPKNFNQYAKAFHKMRGKTSDIVNFLKQGTVPSFWAYPGVQPELVNYPQTGILSAGKKYIFSFRLPHCEEGAVVTEGNVYTFLKKNGDVFSGKAVATHGEVRLSVKITYNGQNSYWPLAIWLCK